MNSYLSNAYTYCSSCCSDTFKKISDTLFPEKLSFNKVVPGTFRHFRTFDDISGLDKEINKTGLSGLKMSGSGQLTGNNFAELAAKLKISDKKKIIILDLRKEPHIYISKGSNENPLPLSWQNKHDSVNADKSSEESVADEQARVKGLYRIALVWDKKWPKLTYIHKVSTEKELVESLGYRYMRLPIIDHTPPTDQQVDEFISIVRDNPDAWIHAHCQVGMGRTGVILSMFDMMHNGGKIKVEDTLKRHKEGGATDLMKIPPKDSWKYQHRLDRKDFLFKFNEYCLSADWRTQLWSDWCKSEARKSH